MSMPPPLSLGGPRRTMRRAAGEKGVQNTNNDAQATKLSCASLGYFKDDLLPLLAKGPPGRKSPLINRGTWARHAAMRQITTDFITACAQQAQQQQQRAGEDPSTSRSAKGTHPAEAAAVSEQLHSSSIGNRSSSSSSSSSSFTQPVCQVVVLGAGSDSTWFNLQQACWPLLAAAHYIELDYYEMVSRKARAILSTEQLLQLLPDETTATTTPAVTAASGGAGGHHEDAAAPEHATWTKQAAAAVSQAQQAQQPHDPLQLVQQVQAAEAQREPASSSATAATAAPSHSCGPVPPAAAASHVQELSGVQYSLVGVDLRHTQQFDAALERAGFDARLPTLYISECVLIYLEPGEAQALLAAAAQKAAQAGSTAAVAIYEQTRPDDAFGVTMISNLEARGCPLRSVMSVPTPASQEQRLTATGWSAAAAADMAAVYYGGSSSSIHSNGSAIPGVAAGCSAPAGPAAAAAAGWLRPQWQAERVRTERLELMDELEEWRLMQEHYVLAIGVTGEGAAGWLAAALQLEHLKALGGK